MENKNCENCYFKIDCPNEIAETYQFLDRFTYCQHYKPDYQTLESQLSTANDLIKQQIEEICGLQSKLSVTNQETAGLNEEKRHLIVALKRAIQGYKNLIELKLIPERYFADTDGYIKEYEAVIALCRPTPVDEEKEQLKAEIHGLRETLGSVKTDIEMAQYSDMAWLEIAISEIEKALSHPTPVDVEKEQLKAEIHGLREALENIAHNKGVPGLDYESGEIVGYALMAKPLQEIAQQALSHPVPVDVEKEVLKEALRLACERFAFHMKDCLSELDEDFMDIFKCNDSWNNYFLAQAKSKIETVK